MFELTLSTVTEIAIAIATAALVAALSWSSQLRTRIASRFSAVTQVAFLTFFLIPLLLLITGGLIEFLPRKISIIIVHSLFISMAIMLPAGLYYFFIATKRESLLNNFLAILDRLGLFGLRKLNRSQVSVSSFRTGSTGTQDLETEFGREKRVRSYFERFEALYGSLPDNFIADAIECTRPRSDTDREQPLPATKISAPLSVRNILPILAVMILSFIGWIITLPLSFDDIDQTESYFVPNNSPVTFAFLGAYFFSLQLLIRRFVRKDLGPNAYVSVALRILLAMIGIWVANQAVDFTALKLSDTTKLAFAFAIGVFPSIAWELIIGVVKRIPGIPWALPNLKQGLDLSELDGLTIWHETRLEEEDIENVANMASADIVDLFLNTRFSANRIIDWVDQSILYTSITTLDATAAPKFRKRLESLGIRSATALLKIGKANVLQAHSVDLGDGLNVTIADWVELLRETVRTFPNLLLVEAWKGVEDGQPAATGTN